MSKSEIEIDGVDCYTCGNATVILHTEADQDPYDDSEMSAERAWWCHDGDKVECHNCGEVGWCSADAETDVEFIWEAENEE